MFITLILHTLAVIHWRVLKKIKVKTSDTEKKTDFASFSSYNHMTISSKRSSRRS